MGDTDLQHFVFPDPASIDAEKYRSRPVFWLGEGPGIVLMHEVFGLTSFVADFGRQIAASGYTVFMPVMFGKPFPEGVARIVNGLGLCINREFCLLAQRKSSPITDWLRALSREVHVRCGGRGVGAIGLCLSGGFVLSLVIDPWVMVAVGGEPSLPFCPLRGLQKKAQATLGISPDQLQQATARSRNEEIPVVGLRFTRDWICPAPRFDTLKSEFGVNFHPIEFDSKRGNPYGIPTSAHSVLTEHYGELKRFISFFPDKDPRKQVIEFLDRQLKSG
jgi:dienelactone hydrolase